MKAGVYAIYRHRVFRVLFRCESHGLGKRPVPGKPNKPVEFIVPAGTGGGADVMARFISPLIEKYKLSPKPFIVINKSGGAGAEGFMYVKGKKGDPYVIVITLSNLFTTPLATGVPFNWRDLTPLSRLALDYFVLWVNAESPHKTAKEYLDAVKKEPGKFLMGGTGTAQEDQIITIMMEQAFGVKFTYVPVQGRVETWPSSSSATIPNSSVNNPSGGRQPLEGGETQAPRHHRPVNGLLFPIGIKFPP